MKFESSVQKFLVFSEQDFYKPENFLLIHYYC